MNFFESRNKSTLDKLEQHLNDLPDFCNEFFIGIHSRTSPLTRINYALDLKIFFDFLSKNIFKTTNKMYTLNDLESLSAFDIEKFIAYLSNYEYMGSVHTCNEKAKERKLSTVRSFFKYFFNKEKLPSNVAAKVESPKIHTKNIVRLQPDEVAKMLDAIEYGHDNFSDAKRKVYEKTRLRNLAIVTLFLGTGIRLSELTGLDENHIDLENNSFIITRKGGNIDQLYFGQEVAKSLQNYLAFKITQRKTLSKQENRAPTTNNKNATQPSIPLFTSSSNTNQRLSIRAIQVLVTKFAKIASPLKKISPHKLRSTFGTNLYHATNDLYVVAEVLGHKSIDTTRKHYAASSEKIKRNATNAIKLRDEFNASNKE